MRYANSWFTLGLCYQHYRCFGFEIGRCYFKFGRGYRSIIQDLWVRIVIVLIYNNRYLAHIISFVKNKHISFYTNNYQSYKYKHTHTYVHTNISNTNTHTYVHTNTHICTHSYVHTNTHICTHTHTHTRTYKHIAYINLKDFVATSLHILILLLYRLHTVWYIHTWKMSWKSISDFPVPFIIHAYFHTKILPTKTLQTKNSSTNKIF